MLIEVDGINHVGKTSLVTLLEARGMNTRKFQRPENPVKQMYDEHIRLAEHPKTWVIDRGHGTEWVMSRILRRKLPYTIIQYWGLDEDLAQRGTTVVYLSAPMAVIEERMAVTGRPWEAPYDQLVEAWGLFLDLTQCRVIRLDGALTTEQLGDMFLHRVFNSFTDRI